MARRVALLIGNQRFRPDSGLPPLQGPPNDVAALSRLLSDPARGQFEVHNFLDRPTHEVLPQIEQALGHAGLDDLFLIYYTGHGRLDRSGRLCLATADTSQSSLLATSIPARQLRDFVDESDCGQVVLVLDCCYSGAAGLKGDVESELRVIEEARGFYILTATSDLQAAREEVSASGVIMGRFTAALVNGIESGAADSNHLGKVLLSDLRRYLERVVTGQTPKFFARNAFGDPLISLSPATALPVLNHGVPTDHAPQQGSPRFAVRRDDPGLSYRASSVFKRGGAVSTLWKPVLGVFFVLAIIILGYVYFTIIRTPHTIIVTDTRPTSSDIPPPPRAPARPVVGKWDVYMSCPSRAAVNEPGAQFGLGLFARAFQDPPGQTQLAMGYISTDTLRVTGYVAFSNGAGTYDVDGTATRNGSSSFAGTGRFGSSTDCKLTINSVD